jgi:hypothetical protein
MRLIFSYQSGENSLIDRMLKETDQIEGGLIKEVGTLEALKEQVCSLKMCPSTSQRNVILNIT